MDYIYQAELESYLSLGVLNHLFLAFSREPGQKKVYVQDRMRENKELLWSLLEQEAHFYVCGDAKSMEKDVKEAVIQVAEVCGGRSREEAEAYFHSLQTQGRYSADVWT